MNRQIQSFDDVEYMISNNADHLSETGPTGSIRVSTGPRHARRRPRRPILKACFPTWNSVLIAIMTCVVAPTALVSLHVHQNPEFSPIDEWAHWDYMTRLADGEMPRIGQKLQLSTVRVLECRLIAIGYVFPRCGSTPSPKAVAGGGYQFEAQQPPGYYALTIPFRWIGMEIFGIDDLTASRLGGIVWLVVGLLLFWTACSLMDLEPKLVGLGALLIASAPTVIYESSYVTNDASSIAAGSLALLLGVLALKRPGRWTAPVMFAGGIFLVALKLPDAMAAVVVSLFFALLAYSQRTQLRLEADGAVPTLRWWWPRGGTILLGSAIGIASWTVVERSLAFIDPKILFAPLRKFPMGNTTILHEALLMLQPLTGSYDPFLTTNTTVSPMSPLSVDLQTIMATILRYLVLAGALAGLFVARRRWSHWIGLISLPTLYVGGVLLGVAIYFEYGVDPGISGRYGLALAPFLVLALVASIRGRWIARGLWLFAVASFGLDVFFMLAR